jgi:hypothetical protein
MRRLAIVPVLKLRRAPTLSGASVFECLLEWRHVTQVRSCSASTSLAEAGRYKCSEREREGERESRHSSCFYRIVRILEMSAKSDLILILILILIYPLTAIGLSSGGSSTVLYCTVLYCTVLYSTVL